MQTFAQFAATVLDRRAEEGIRGIKSERNRFDLHIVTAPFAAKPLTDITPADIREWLRIMQQKQARDTRGERKLSDPTIKRSFALVSSVGSAAVEDEHIEHNFCHGVKMRKRADLRATQEKWAFLTLDEQKLIAACKRISLADRLAIRFAIATGLRQGEQFNLELKDLHVETPKPHVLVRFGSKGLPPKSGKIRKVQLLKDGLVAARQWLEMLSTFAPKNPHGLVFPYANGGRRGVGKPLGRGPLLREYLAIVGITRRVRWHDLRHTCASNLVSGVLGRRWTLEEIRPLMGHSSIVITQRYSHIGEAELERAAEETSFSHGVAANDVVISANDNEILPDTERSPGSWRAA